MRYPVADATADRTQLRDAIHIAAACNERYALPLAVMVSSLGTHLAADRRAVVHVLASRVGADARRKVERSVGTPRVEIHWIEVGPDRLDGLQGTLRSFDSVSIESYYRLLLPELLSPELCRVIYLDCDVVVNHDIGGLWDCDVSGTCLLAVPEFAPDARLVSSRAGIRFHRELGLPDDLPFFNSGVLLLNLDRIRARGVMHDAFEYLDVAKPHLRWHDQEALNVAVAGDWRPLDPRWNVTMHLYCDPVDPEHERLRRDPFLIHYNFAIKPWHADFRAARRDLFFEHVDRTAWAGQRPSPLPFGAAARLGRAAIRALRKRFHRLSYAAFRARSQIHHWRMLHHRLAPLDSHPIPTRALGEIRMFVARERPGPELVALLARRFEEGVGRAFVVVADGLDPSAEVPREIRDRIHFHSTDRFENNARPLLRRLLHRYGEGHWCLLSADGVPARGEHTDTSNVANLCRSLDRSGSDGIACDTGKTRSHATRRFASDPLTGRVFATDSGRETTVLLKYRRDLLVSEDLRAAFGARITRL